MGTDIQGYIELRHPDTREWEFSIAANEIIAAPELYGGLAFGQHLKADWVAGTVRYPFGYTWRGGVNIESIIGLERNYTMFGCLFGVQNHAHFRPIAPRRGIPRNRSEMASYQYRRWGRGAGGAHDASWISLDEILAIDWEEEAEARPDFVEVLIEEQPRFGYGKEGVFETLSAEHRRLLEETGEFSSRQKIEYRVICSSGRKAGEIRWYKYLEEQEKYTLTEKKKVPLGLFPEKAQKALKAGSAYAEEYTLKYVWKKLKRKDALTPAWELLFDLMKRLGADYGTKNVRLVAWFDS